MAYDYGVCVYLCGNRHGQRSLLANVAPAQTKKKKKKSAQKADSNVWKKASELLSQN